MRLALVQIGRALVIALGALASSAEAAPAGLETARRPTRLRTLLTKAGVSHRLKDVCEAIQFIVFSIGVAAAMDSGSGGGRAAPVVLRESNSTSRLSTRVRTRGRGWSRSSPW